MTIKARTEIAAAYKLRNSIKHLMANTSELVILTVMKQRIPKQLERKPRKKSEASTGSNGKT